MTREIRFLVLVVSLIIFASVMYCGDTVSHAFAQTSTEPKITLFPSGGPPGTEVTITGEGFPQNYIIVEMKIPWERLVYLKPISGAFTYHTTVPATQSPGTYSILTNTIVGYNRFKEPETLTADADFTVTAKVIPTTTTPAAIRSSMPTPPPPPPNSTKTGEGTNSPTSTTTGSYSYKEPTLKVNPSSGPPGTKFYVTCLDFSPTIALSIEFDENYYTTTTDPSGTCVVGIEVDPNSPPGTYSILAEGITNTGDDSSNSATSSFTVIAKKVIPSTHPLPAATGHNTTNPPPPPPNGTKTGAGAATGTTSTSGAVSNNPTNPPPPPPPPPQPPGDSGNEGGTGSEGGTGNEGSGTDTGSEGGPTAPSGVGPDAGANPPTGPSSYPVTWRPAGKPEESGATFRIIKSVEGGDASPTDFSFTITLTGPQGSAQYSPTLNHGETSGRDYQSAVSDFNIDLPQGNTLSEGSYQVTETNPGDYTPEYSRGCSGTYGNDGYMYWCFVTNVKVGEISEDEVRAVKNNPTPTSLPQPNNSNKTLPVTTSSTTSKTMTYSRAAQTSIPSWVKNNAKWWTQGTIDDKTFVQSMQYISSGGSTKISQSASPSSSGSQQVPAWVKNTVKWWVNGQVSDDEFKNAVKYMLSTKVIAAAQ